MTGARGVGGATVGSVGGRVARWDGGCLPYLQALANLGVRAYGRGLAVAKAASVELAPRDNARTQNAQ